MAINERLIDTKVADAGNDGGGTGNQEEGLVLHLDANDVDSYDGDGSIWYDIKDHEYTPATNVDEHFNTVLYTGDGSASGQSITGVGFQPDLVWLKSRVTVSNNTGGSHMLMDSLRGVNKWIRTETTNGNLTPNALNSFDSDGFTTDNDYIYNNQSGRNYVAWCFKAGGAPSGSDKVSIDGTSYSTFTDAGLSEPIGTTGQKLSVNTELGFSVVYTTGTSVNTSNAKLTHGLNQEPEMSIYKFTSTTSSWYTYHKDVGKDRYLVLNATDAQSSAFTGRFYSDNNHQNAQLDSSLRDYVVYNFISKRGVSKVGSFVGTGAAGKKINTGFEPAFIITKRSSSSGANWAIIDNKRSTDSDKNDYLAADTNNAEATSGSGITFNRDGFTFNGGSFNTNGATHIYYAVAKSTNENGLVEEVTTETDYVQEADDNFYDSVQSLTTTSTSGTFTIATLQDPTVNIGFGNNGSTEANNTIEFTMSKPLSVDGFIAGANSQSYRGYTGIVKFYGSNDGSAYTLLGSAQQATSGFALNPTREEISDSFTATTLYNYFKMTLSNMERGTYGGIRDFIPSLSSGTFTETITTGSDTVLHLDADSFPEKGESGYSNTPSTWTALTGSNGTISGATFDSELGNWLDFDGSNDYVSIPSTSTTPIDFTSKNYSIECWVNIDSNTTHPILAKYGTTDSLRSTNFSITAGGNLSLYERIGGSGQSSLSTSALSLNTWRHVCVVRKSSQVEFYIDGELDNTVAATSTPNSGGAQNINIGSQANGNYSFLNGRIGQVRVYSSALTQDEVRQNFNFTKSSYPNGYNAVGTNMTSADWNSYGYFDFSGSSEYFTNNDISLDTASPFTFCGWVYPTQNNDWQRVFSFGTSGTECTIQKRGDNNNSRLIGRVSNSIKFDVDGAVLTNNQWNFIAVTGDGSSVKMYVNNNVAVTDNISGTHTYDNLQLGWGAGTTEYFHGRISKFKVYDRELTSTEITALFNEGQ
jgi:hypothetical protein